MREGEKKREGEEKGMEREREEESCYLSVCVYVYVYVCVCVQYLFTVPHCINSKCFNSNINLQKKQTRKSKNK